MFTSQKKHPFFGWDYDAIHAKSNISVHGGLTFADSAKGKKSWVLGFDCAHYGDKADPEILKYFKSSGIRAGVRATTGTIRTLAYVESECRSLAKQLKAFMPFGDLLPEKVISHEMQLNFLGD